MGVGWQAEAAVTSSLSLCKAQLSWLRESAPKKPGAAAGKQYRMGQNHCLVFIIFFSTSF